MSSVVYLRAMSDPSLAPCLVLVDMQREYLAGTRLMSMPEAEKCLGACRIALKHARSMGFPVAHVRQVSRSAFFNRATDFSTWIDGFEPNASEMVFDRDRPSCYSNSRFAELMQSCGGHFVIAGFAGETACLSTVIDAYHRNHSFSYLIDASASHSLGQFDAESLHRAIAEIVGVYGRVLKTNEWVLQMSDIAIRAGA